MWRLICFVVVTTPARAEEHSSQTISFPVLQDCVFGSGEVALNAVASSGLPVTYTLVAGPARIVGSSLALTGVGTVRIRASQDGDAYYFAAPSEELSFAVSPAAASLQLAGLSATYDGNTHAVTITTVPAGLDVTVTYGGAALPPTNAGSYPIVATINDARYQGSVSGTLTVAKAAAGLEFELPAELRFRNRPFELTARSASQTTVVFSIVSGPATVGDARPPDIPISNPDGITPIDPTVYPPEAGVPPRLNEFIALTETGTVVVMATQAASANFEAASVQHEVTVLPNLVDPALFPPEFTSQPQDKVGFAGGYVNFSAYQTGNPTHPAITVFWQWLPPGAADWVDIVSGGDFVAEGTGWLSFSPRIEMDGARFRCVAANAIGTTTSREARLTVRPGAPSSVTITPGSQAVLPGADVTFTATNNGTPPFTYQWYKGNLILEGATSPTLTLSNVQVGATGSYRVVVTGVSGYASSPLASLYVVLPPVITTQPVATAVTLGANLQLTAAVESNGPTDLQWYRNGALLDGAVSATLTVAVAQAESGGTYQLRVTNLAGTASSNEVAVTVVPVAPPAQGSDSLLQWLDPIGNLALWARPTGTGPFSYQWYFNGEPLPGETGNSLTIPRDSITRLGEYYVAISNGAGTTIGSTITVDDNYQVPQLDYHWIDAVERDGVAYFLFAAPTPRIERYDLSAHAWLATWALPEAPVGLAISTDTLYIAYAGRVDRHRRDFTDPTPYLTSPGPVLGIGLMNGFFVMVSATNSSSEARCGTYRLSDGGLMAERVFFSGPKQNLVIAEAMRALWGTNYARDRLHAVRMLSDGSWEEPTWQGGSVGTGGRAMALADGNYVGTAYGRIYRADDTTAVATFGTWVDDAIDAPTGGYFVLHRGRVGRLDAEFREEASRPLATRASRLFACGDELFVVRQPAAAEDWPAIEAMPQASLMPPTAAVVKEPVDLPIWSPQVEADEDGNLAIYSKLHRNVFRWSAAAWDYQGGVGLTSSPNLVALSPGNRALYFEAQVAYLRRVRLDDGKVDTFHATLALPEALTTAGNVVVYRYNESGTGTGIRSVVDGNSAMSTVRAAHAASKLTYSDADRRLYYLRSGPDSELGYQVLSANGGMTGLSDDTSLRTTRYFRPPLGVSPDGSRIVTGQGLIVDHDSLKVVARLPAEIVDAAWTAGRLHVMRVHLGGVEIQSHDAMAGDWSRRAVAVYDGQPIALTSLRGDRLLLITSSEGRLRFRMLAAATLIEIDPQQAVAPAIVLQPADVAGAPDGPLLLSVATTGGAMPHYQWQACFTGSENWIDLLEDGNVSGTRTGQLFVRRQPDAWAGARFRVIVANDAGSVVSDMSRIAQTGPAAVAVVAAGSDHLVFTRADGSVWTSGQNSAGQLGDGTNINRSEPYLLAPVGLGLAGHIITGLLRPDGTLAVTGSGFTGLIPGYSGYSSPILRQAEDHVVAAALASGCLLYLKDDATLWLRSASGSILLDSDVTAFSTSGETHYYIRADGTLWGRGANRYGELGGSPQTIRDYPVQIATEVREVTADGGTVLFIRRDGSLWGVGNNVFGQLGDGTTGNRAEPVLIDQGVRQAAGGSWHSIYVKEDSSVWAMGHNYSGQLGDGSKVDRLSPILVAVGGVQVAVGNDASYILKSDGTLWAVGLNQYGTMGASAGGAAYQAHLEWVQVAAGMSLPAEACRDLRATVGSASAGVRLVWAQATGASNYEVWRSSTADFAGAVRLAQRVALPLYYDTSAVAEETYYYWVKSVNVSGGTTVSTAVSGSRGSAMAPAFTLQPAGQTLPLGGEAVWRVAATGEPIPVYRWQYRASGGTDWSDLAESYPFSGVNSPELRMAYFHAERDGSAYRCIAWNSAGATASEAASLTLDRTSMAPTLFGTLADATVRIGTSVNLYAAISNPDPYGNLTVAWRKNGMTITGASSPQLNIFPAADADAGGYSFVASNSYGSVESRVAVVTIVPAEAATALAAGTTHSVFAQANGQARGMGDNANGKLGVYNGSNGTSFAVPHPGAGEAIVGVSAGPAFSLFLAANGRVYGAGLNTYGQTLGGSGLYSSVFSQVVAIAAGGEHSLLLKANGTLWAVGRNDTGQLGDGSTTNRTSPVQVQTAVRFIAAGARHSFLIRDDGTLWAMGDNSYGQLGDGTLTARATPVLIESQVTMVSSAATHTLYLRSDGSLWGMGANTAGQLGDRLRVGGRAELPFRIATDVKSCAAGLRHSAFIKTDGSLWLMGGNEDGQLGLGRADALVPTPTQAATGVLRVATGGSHTLFLDANGAIWGCGDNSSRQLGMDTPAGFAIVPVRLWPAVWTAPEAPAAAVAVAAGSGTVRITWSGVPAAVDYEVWRGTIPDVDAASLLAADVEGMLYVDDRAPAGSVYYWVKARNPAGMSGISPRATANPTGIEGLPVISIQPRDVTVPVGSDASFQLYVSSGTSPMTYQLRRNGALLNDSRVNGYSLKEVTLADAGEYEIVVSNSIGSVVSVPVQLNVRPAFQSINFPEIPNQGYGSAPIRLQATADSGLPVTYTVLSGPAVLSGDLLTLVDLGEIIIRASQSGSTDYEAAYDVERRFYVLPGVLPMTLSGLVTVYDGTSKPVGIGGVPGGIACLVNYDGSPVPPTSAGVYRVSARIDDARFAGTCTGFLLIERASQTISFLPFADRVFDDRPISLHANASSGLPVTFFLDSGPAAIDGSALWLSGPGLVSVRAVQTGNENYEAAADMVRSFVVGESFLFWEQTKFTAEELLDENISGAAADPDGDGLANLMEYALGFEPMSANTADQPVVTTDATHWLYTFTHPTDRTDVTYVVQYSTNLTTWTTAAVGDVSQIGSTASTVTIQARQALTTANVFFRLKVATQ